MGVGGGQGTGLCREVGEVEELASVERWSCSRGAHVWWNTLLGGGGTCPCREVVL